MSEKSLYTTVTVDCPCCQMPITMDVLEDLQGRLFFEMDVADPDDEQAADDVTLRYASEGSEGSDDGSVD